MDKPASIDAYLEGLPPPHRAALEHIRRVIHSAAPEAVEAISYGIPALKFRGRALIHFGSAKKHCAIYGTSAGGTFRFDPAQPPSDEFIRSLVAEQLEKVEAALATRKRPPANPRP